MQTTNQTGLEVGTTVYSSDGDKIGDIAEVQQNYFVVEKGFIFTEDLYIPMSAVSSRDGDGIRLSLSKDEINTQDWSSVPVLSDQDADGPVGYGGQHTDTTNAYETGNADLGTTDTGSAFDDRDVIERREERLTVDKQAEQAGSVHVGKRVVEEQESVDVPIAREEVTMERRSVDRPASGDTLTEDSIDVPVYEEQVVAGKEARTVEELEVGKTARTDTERVSDTVRREEFDIDDETTRP